MHWKVRQQFIPLEKTLLMGVLNLTPDSFSDGGRFSDVNQALDQAALMIREGADILDLGAESTRPGAFPVSAAQELDRLLPVLERLLKNTSTLISIDTTKSEVARVCLEKGAHIINDVSGLMDSGPAMAELIREFEAGLVLMHRRGTPLTMNSMTHYQDLIPEICGELELRIQSALSRGVLKEQIVLDPGLGFAKNPEDSFKMMAHLESFLDLGFPVLAGPSRKSFIGKVTGRSVEEREFGTAAAVAIAVIKGVHIVRVHAVGAMRDAVRVAEAIKGENYVRSF
ncbi:MAG: dihydropteroate synthase [Candidatus Omnitrophica bacterium]|nr:dihydropteroate synthase [Candidatus Omnitrophota bacterium]